MRARLLELISLAAVITALVNLTSFPVLGQAPTAGKTETARTSPPPKTP